MIASGRLTYAELAGFHFLRDEIRDLRRDELAEAIAQALPSIAGDR